MADVARSRLADWLRAQIAGKAEVSLRRLTDQAVQEIASDPEWLTAILAESVRPLVYDIARRVVADTRGAAVVLGDEVVTRAILQARAGVLALKWSGWLEHVGDRHVALMDMTAVDLRAAAGERRKRATSELQIASMFDSLAIRLNGDQRVRDLFTAEDLDSIAKEHAAA